MKYFYIIISYVSHLVQLLVPKGLVWQVLTYYCLLIQNNLETTLVPENEQPDTEAVPSILGSLFPHSKTRKLMSSRTLEVEHEVTVFSSIHNFVFYVGDNHQGTFSFSFIFSGKDTLNCAGK